MSNYVVGNAFIMIAFSFPVLTPYKVNYRSLENAYTGGGLRLKALTFSEKTVYQFHSHTPYSHRIHPYALLLTAYPWLPMPLLTTHHICTIPLASDSISQLIQYGMNINRFSKRQRLEKITITS